MASSRHHPPQSPADQDDDDLLPRRRWDDDPDEDSEHDDAGAPDGYDPNWRSGMAGLLGGAPGRGLTAASPLIDRVAEASSLLARLDDRISRSPEPIRRGWTQRWANLQGVASARLDGFFVHPDDLYLVVADTTAGLIDEAMRRALVARDLHLASTQYLARHVWSVDRLAAAARLRLKRGDRWRIAMAESVEQAKAENLDAAALQALFGRIDVDPALMRDRIAEVLDPARLDVWAGLSPLVGAACLLGRWHDSRAADLVGGAPGRFLADAWPRRHAAIRFAVMGIAEGFRAMGGRDAYQPTESDAFVETFLKAVAYAARSGLALHERLESAQRQITESFEGARRDLVAPRLAPVLLSSPLVSISKAATALNVSDEGVRRAMADLAAKGLVVEASGRNGWRLWRLAR